MIKRAIDLRKGDEFVYRGELHRVTANIQWNGERKISTYVVERPRTAPFIIFWPNDEEITVEKKAGESYGK